MSIDGSPHPEPSFALSELKPSEHLVSDVFRQFIRHPDRQTKFVLNDLEYGGQAPLYDYLVERALIYSEPAALLKWPLMYWKIHRRAAEESRVQIPLIDSETIIRAEKLATREAATTTFRELEIEKGPAMVKFMQILEVQLDHYQYSAAARQLAADINNLLDTIIACLHLKSSP